MRLVFAPDPIWRQVRRMDVEITQMGILSDPTKLGLS